MDKISVIFYLIPSKKKSLFGYTGLTDGGQMRLACPYILLYYSILVFLTIYKRTRQRDNLFKLLVILGHFNHTVRGIGGLLLGMVLRVIMSFVTFIYC